MKKEIDFPVDNDLFVLTTSLGPCLLTPKSKGSLRFCTDYRKVNKLTVPDAYSLSLSDDPIDAVGQSNSTFKIDLRKG